MKTANKSDKFKGGYMKVICTETFIHGKPLKKLQELGYKGTSCQFRIICGCNSRSDANKQWKASTGINKAFEGNRTKELNSENEIAVAGNGGCFVCIGGTEGNDYASVKEIFEKVK